MKTLNIKNFRNVLQKVTLDYLIQFCQLNFKNNIITTNMIAATRDVVIQHNLQNHVIGGISAGDEITFNFVDPQLRILPQLKALESIDIEESEIEITDEELKLLAGQWGGGTIHFNDESVLANHIMRRSPRELPYFYSTIVTPQMHFGFKPVKAIAPTYGKIYFTVDGGNFYLETADKTNMFTDNWRLALASGLDVDDLTICFEFPNFSNLMNVIATDEKQYTMNFAWDAEEDRGMLFAHTESKDEKYFLFSRSI